MKFIKEGSFYRGLATLALPIAAQELLKAGLALADNIMVGSLSETEISGVSFANQPVFLFAMIVFGLASGGGVLIAQYYGKGDMKAIKKVTSITLMINVVTAFVFAAVAFCIPEILMRGFTQDAAVIAAGSEYMRIIAVSLLFYGTTNALVYVMRCINTVKPLLLMNFFAFLLNIFLNWVLIYGQFGIPAMGVKGAAYGTLISRIFECILVIIYVRFVEKKLQYRFKQIFSIDRVLVRDFMKFSLPVTLNEAFWGLGYIGLTVVIGQIGTVPAAAAAIVATLQQFMSVVLYGVGSATSVIIGNILGSGRRDYAIRCSRTLSFVGVGVGIISGALLFLVSEPAFSLYNITPETLNLCRSFVIVAAITVAVDAINVIAIVGILRGGGDTRFALLADIITLWGIALPLGILTGFVWEVSVVLVFLALRSDVYARAFMCTFRIKSNKWAANLTRENISDAAE